MEILSIGNLYVGWDSLQPYSAVSIHLGKLAIEWERLTQEDGPIPIPMHGRTDGASVQSDGKAASSGRQDACPGDCLSPVDR